jgi:hypothetical protein
VRRGSIAGTPPGPDRQARGRSSPIRSTAPWYNPSMRDVPRRIGRRRTDNLVLLSGGAIVAVGSVMPWIQGSTRLNGTVDWSGLDDTGEGLMLIAIALAVAAWVRWREPLERELTPRVRFFPLVVAVAGALLWLIAAQKMLYLSWWDLEVGARPQLGLLVTALGLGVMIAGGWLAATDPAAVARARDAKKREERRSGAGGDGAASDRYRRGGGGRPPGPGGYSVVSRVDPTSVRASAEGDDDRVRG